MKKIGLVVLIIVILVVGMYFWADGKKQTDGITEAETSEVTTLVEEFGDKLKAVSLLASDEIAASSIRDNYTPYITEDMLEIWINNPSQAPGREVSSPWPDRIEVADVQKVYSNQYIVSGHIIEITSVEEASGGEAARRNVELLVDREGDSYLISRVTLGDYDTTDTRQTFIEEGHFSLEYPQNFIVEAESGLGGNIGDSILKISFPEDAYKEMSTNYNDAYFLLSSSSDEEDVSMCMSFEDLGRASADEDRTIRINGTDFASWDGIEPAAGNLYNSRLYRTVREDRCYEIALTIHTGNINNYPRGTVTEFDQELAFTVLDDMLQSFTFE